MLSLDVFRHEVNRNYIFVFQKKKKEGKMRERDRERLYLFLLQKKKSEGKERNYD
jgi:hypothetical protein